MNTAKTVFLSWREIFLILWKKWPWFICSMIAVSSVVYYLTSFMQKKYSSDAIIYFDVNAESNSMNPMNLQVLQLGGGGGSSINASNVIYFMSLSYAEYIVSKHQDLLVNEELMKLFPKDDPIFNSTDRPMIQAAVSHKIRSCAKFEKDTFNPSLVTVTMETISPQMSFRLLSLYLNSFNAYIDETNYDASDRNQKLIIQRLSRQMLENTKSRTLLTSIAESRSVGIQKSIPLSALGLDKDSTESENKSIDYAQLLEYVGLNQTVNQQLLAGVVGKYYENILEHYKNSKLFSVLKRPGLNENPTKPKRMMLTILAAVAFTLATALTILIRQVKSFQDIA